MLVKLKSHGVDLARILERQVERRLRLVLGASAACVRRPRSTSVTSTGRAAARASGARSGWRCPRPGSVRTEATDADFLTALDGRRTGRDRSIRRAVERRRDGWPPGGRDGRKNRA